MGFNSGFKGLNPTFCIGLQRQNLLWSSCPLTLWNFWIRSVAERALDQKFSRTTNMNISAHWELELHPHVYQTLQSSVTKSASTLQSWIWQEMWWESQSFDGQKSQWPVSTLSSMKITQTEKVTVAVKRRFSVHYDIKLTFGHQNEHQPLWLVWLMRDPCSPHDSFHPVPVSLLFGGPN